MSGGSVQPALLGSHWAPAAGTLLSSCLCLFPAAAKLLQSCPTLCNPRWQPTRLRRPWDSPGKNTGVGCHFLLQCMKVKSEIEVAQLCPTLRDPMDCSPPGSSVHGIFQARVLEWGAIAFSICVHEFTPISSSIRSIRERPAVTTQEPRQPEGARAEPSCALVPDSESVSGGQSELRGSSAQTHSRHFLPLRSQSGVE